MQALRGTARLRTLTDENKRPGAVLQPRRQVSRLPRPLCRQRGLGEHGQL